MRRLALVVGMVWTFLGAAPTGAAEPTPLVLETSALRLELQQTPHLHLRQLLHKRSGQSLTGVATPRSLYALTLLAADGAAQQVTAERAASTTAQVVATAAGKELRIRQSGWPDLNLAVEMTILAPVDDPLLRCSIRVENGTGRKLQTVRFPQFNVGDLTAGGDDFLVLPALAGSLVEKPAQAWRTGQSVSLSYPGNLSAQFLAYQNRTAGVYLAGSDAAGHPMSLAAIKLAGGLQLWHDYTPVADAANRAPAGGSDKVWASPYPVMLGVTQGSWCDTADLYKRWAVQQPWCARRLAQRDDIPAWWKAGPAVHTCEVRTYDAQRSCNGSYYPKLVEHIRRFSQKIDGPVVAMLAGWENHRRWTAGDYFPLFDAAVALPAIAQLNREGFRPFVFLSGLFYTYRNAGRDVGEMPDAQQYRAAYVIDQKTKQPREFVLNESNPNGEWKRHSYAFCAASPATTTFFGGVIDQLHAAGIDVVQMDQTTSGGASECYATDHGHPPGVGRYQSTAFWKLLADLRAHGKNLSKDFVLFHEEPHEQLMPYLDGFHVREYKEKSWYRGMPGAVGIPLFDYLYHEYAIGYGGDSASLSATKNLMNVRSHAVNLVTGRTPGASIWSSHDAMDTAHADQIAVLRAHSRLLKTRAGEFLMLGTMLHPLELNVPKLPLDVPVRRGDKWVKEPLPTPAILTSSWLLPPGRIGHLFVNIDEKPQPLKVALDARNAPAAAAYTGTIYRSTGDGEFRPLGQKTALPQDLTLDLQPQEVVFVELQPR